MLLKSKVAVITGAASLRGIGKATARAFAAQGASIVILDLDLAAAQAAAAAAAGADVSFSMYSNGAITVGDITQQAGATPFVAHLVDFSRRGAGASPTARFVPGGVLPVAAGLRIGF